MEAETLVFRLFHSAVGNPVFSVLSKEVSTPPEILRRFHRDNVVLSIPTVFVAIGRRPSTGLYRHQAIEIYNKLTELYQ